MRVRVRVRVMGRVMGRVRVSLTWLGCVKLHVANLLHDAPNLHAWHFRSCAFNKGGAVPAPADRKECSGQGVGVGVGLVR